MELSRFQRRADGLVAVLLILATVTYLWFWPRDFYYFDEGLFLYESKKILDGAILYRDLFEIVTPLTWYLMAFSFRIFGTDIATARAVMAIVHGLIAVVVFLTCRRLGVRRGISLAAGVAHVAICFPALTIATPHWFSTLFTLLLLLVCLRRPWTSGASWLILPGLLAGTLIAVQQQKGVVISAVVCALLLVDHVVKRLHGASARRPAKEVAYFAGGILIVVVPLVLFLLATAGPNAVFSALIRHPLVNYRRFNHAPWGMYAPWAPEFFVHPLFMKYMPLILPVLVLRGLAKWMAGADAEELRPVLTQLVFGVFCILSIAYFPDYAHIALIAPVFFIMIADTAEWMLRSVGSIAPRFAGAAGHALVLCFLAGLAFQLDVNLHRRQRLYPATHMTALGRVDFANPEDIVLIDKLQELLRDTTPREIFCYPFCAGFYLMVGADNPTRYQMLVPEYSGAEQIQEALDSLESHRTRYVIVLTVWVNWERDPVIRYLNERYERVDLGLPSSMPGVVLFSRKQ